MTHGDDRLDASSLVQIEIVAFEEFRLPVSRSLFVTFIDPLVALFSYLPPPTPLARAGSFLALGDVCVPLYR